MAKNFFTKTWDSATEEIAEIYEPRTFDLLEKKNPELYKKIHSAEDKVNLHWDKDSDSFKNSVNLWKDLMRQAIKIVSEAASGVKKEVPEERSLNIFERIKETQEK